ncbi:hypothetical protein Kpol_1013p8 [Vanderwaltozyma polyspora DSM 70294]|uniref:Trimethylguanosine synthase n=1 Tax=Vanderwaltozyma polyspora (strain ATCC 22028 / DSM 70294 / BCRC 21397 / CBS 2163 / NBRC 10782 / NRRL Y-8283 / UCD 57-17) TaxID=436907 RepID=A7TH56_VANPO|nr:uncharacterized protein Kpol_1013p8 [Vanderwaltozyma polyspora DSM 70294]EDO18337.1 hypothetical protein Kpol_1013p8 [Vanderwaltozyma polyspora DSM 70294]
MDKKSFKKGHFLHIERKKYRKEYKHLKNLFKQDSLKIIHNEEVKDRSIYKYWIHRKKLFSLIGTSPIYMTHELWFSVTPEVIAIFIAKFVKACLPNATKILDIFCGGGGNLIQFAKLFPKVYGVDYSLEHLYCTYKNAISYDVADRIWLKYGSWPRLAAKGRFDNLGIDCVFASPPWGGPQYLKQDVYDLENMLEPKGITDLLQSCANVSDNIILFLPRNSKLLQLSRATRKVFGLQAKCKVVYVKQNGYLKGMLCIWGDALINYNELPNEIDDEVIANESNSSDEVIDNASTSADNKEQKSSEKKFKFNYDLYG